VAAQPVTAFADGVRFGVRGGYYTKVDEPFVGAELLARVAPRLYFNPNVEYVFVDNGTYMTFNGDFHYDFPTHSRTYTWLGAGLALVRVDPEGPANASRWPSGSGSDEEPDAVAWSAPSPLVKAIRMDG
jgi:hypothetical protein